MTGSNTSSVKIFGRDAAGYDNVRRGLIPCFDFFYGSALDLIDDWGGGKEPRVLDIGAGTGLFSSLLLTRVPGARVHLLDASGAMLDEARQLLSGHAVTFECSDMAEASFGEGEWDLVISALAIHHLDDPAKKSLFRKIHASLREGGLFVNAEQVLGSTPAQEDRYRRLWLAQVRGSGVSEHEITKAEERMRHDRCVSVGNQLFWLQEVGFRETDCVFKMWRFAVLAAWK